MAVGFKTLCCGPFVFSSHFVVNLLSFRAKLDEWVEAIHFYADYLPNFGKIKFYLSVGFDVEHA